MPEDSVELIHQDHALLIRSGLEDVYDAYLEEGRLDPLMIIWPSQTVNFAGVITDDMIPFQLPENPGEWPAFIADAVKRTHAWCVALYEQRPGEIVVIFESPIGTSSWHIPIEDHGDVRALGDVSDVKVDTDYVGAVWSPATPASAVRAGTQR